jgi:deoxyribonuclease-1
MYLIFNSVRKCILILLLGCGVASAVEPEMSDYDYIASQVFWNRLYDEGGWTLYCGYRFDLEGRSEEGYAIGIDQIYATEWILDHLNCASRSECYAQNKQFRQMEADMHNLYPAWSDLMVYRSGRSYGNIPGEDSRFDQCDFEWNPEIVEPRDLSKGNVARSILYMNRQYKLPVSAEMMAIMKAWNKQDPPSEQERIRNDRIEQLQGQRNPYIDNPGLADRPGVVRGR